MDSFYFTFNHITMKRHYITLVAVFTLLFCYQNQVTAQKLPAAKVPAAVAQTFAKQFPAAKRVKWEMESANEFEANFKLAKVKYSAKLDQSGALLETETAIKKSDLPTAVLQALKTQFVGYTVEEIEKITYPDSTIAYEMEVEKGEEEYELLMDSSGKVLKKEVEKED
jgi:Putative beta-lactamase-inhibitor-like, PepSY-like